MPHLFRARIAFWRYVIHVLIAIALIAIPMLVTFDRGGIYAWDQWFMAVSGCFLLVGCVLGRSVQNGPAETCSLRNSLWRWSAFLLLVAITSFCVFQLIDLPAAWVRALSPGSFDAHTTWYSTATGKPPSSHFPISVCEYRTETVLWNCLLYLAFCFTATVVFANRNLTIILLIALAFQGVIQSVAGCFDLINSVSVYPFQSGGLGNYFGPFALRNNAGVPLNIGLGAAASLALTCSSESSVLRRILSGAKLGAFLRKQPTELTDGYDNISTYQRKLDPLFVYALIALFIIFITIIAMGSRGALFGAVIGLLSCLLLIVPVKMVPKFIAVLSSLLVGIILVILIIGLEATTINRFAVFFDSADWGDGRFPHWSDAVQGAKSYLPIGSGVGTYGFAYLPFQQIGSGSWFVHADGQAVEWWLESGFLSLAFFLSFCRICYVSIKRLLSSTELSDRQLAFASIFAFPAVISSQTFDSGMTLPAVMLPFVVLVSALASRAAGLETIITVEPLHGLRKPIVKIVGLVSIPLVASLMILVLSWVVIRTNLRAKSEFLYAIAELEVNSQESPITELQSLDARLAEQIKADTNYFPLRLKRSETQLRLFRHEYTVLLTENNGFSPKSAYEFTMLQRLRGRITSTGTAFTDTVPEESILRHLQIIEDLSFESLKLCPLLDTARWNLINLDFILTERERSSALMWQLLQLRSRTASVLDQVADAAVVVEDWDVAEVAWRQQLMLGFGNWNKIFADIRSTQGAISLEDVVPNNRKVVLAATEDALKHSPDFADEWLLGLAAEYLERPIDESERKLKRVLEKR